MASRYPKRSVLPGPAHVQFLAVLGLFIVVFGTVYVAYQLGARWVWEWGRLTLPPLAGAYWIAVALWLNRKYPRKTKRRATRGAPVDPTGLEQDAPGSIRTFRRYKRRGRPRR